MTHQEIILCLRLLLDHCGSHCQCFECQQRRTRLQMDDIDSFESFKIEVEPRKISLSPPEIGKQSS